MDQTAIVVAALSLLGVIVTTVGVVAVAYMAAGNRKLNEVKDSVGMPNGHGTINDGIGKVIQWQNERDERMEELESQLRDVRPFLESLAESLAALQELGSDYSHEWKHALVNKMAAVAGFTELLWNELHPENPISFGGESDDGRTLPPTQ